MAAIAVSAPVTTASYDPTARSCGFCYGNLPTTTAATSCPSCPRLYCGPACCSFDESTHSFWCGKVGEKGIDFEVIPIKGKGLGLITKRAFERGEKILAERPVATTTNVINGVPSNKGASQEESEKTNENIRRAAMALTPLDGNLDDKFNSNGVCINVQDAAQVSLEDKGAAGLFLIFSRTNHACLGNSDHYYDHQHGVHLLVANDSIPAGTEVTFPYTRTGKERHNDLHWRGFDCNCKACQSPALDAKVNQMSVLDDLVIEMGGHASATKRAEAVEKAHLLLHIYDEVNASCRDYARIHYDLFQILVTQQASLEQAQHHMVQAYEYALSFCGYEGHETVVQYKGYVEHPELHSNYRVID